MPKRIPIERGSDETVVVPVPELAAGWSATVPVREWPDGPVVHRWDTSDGSAVIESGELILLTDDSSEWAWSTGEFKVYLTSPQGVALTRGPWPVRVRGAGPT